MTTRDAGDTEPVASPDHSRDRPILSTGLVETLVLGLLAAAPILASVVRALPYWRPVGDTAAITLRAADVFTRHSPLVGMPTTLSDSVGQAVHHPGPLEFWAIALGQLIVDSRLTPMLVVAAINVVAVIATVAIAGWLGGRHGRVLAAALLVLCTWSLRGEILIDPYNPYAAWLPLGAFMLALVGIAHRHWWALPVGILMGSYAAQAHVSLVVPVALVSLVALVWVTLRDGVPTAERARGVVPQARVVLTEHRLPWLAAGVITVVAWAPVLVDLVAGRGNLVVLARAAGSDDPILGWSGAWQVVARGVSSPPWLVADRSAFDTVAPVSTAQQVLALGLLVAAVGGVVLARRRWPAVATTLVVALGGLVGGLAAASRIPDTHFAVYALHNFLWLWPFTALLWGAVVALLAAVATSEPRIPRVRAHLVTAVGLAAVVVVAAVAVLQPPVRTSVLAGRHGAATAAAAEQLLPQLRSDEVVLVEVLADIEQSAVAMGLVLELERRGVAARVPEMWEGSFGSHRVHRGEALDAHLIPLLGPSPAEAPFPGLELVASHDPERAWRIELAAANAALIDQLERDGGLSVLGGEAVTGEDLTEMVVRGEVLGLERLNLITSPQIPAAVFDRYAEAQEGPVLYLRVYAVTEPGS